MDENITARILDDANDNLLTAKVTERILSLSYHGHGILISRLREKARLAAQEQFQKLEHVPTDVFLPALDPPLRRDSTRIGGLPYWPVSRPWPMDEDGKPYNFVAQFDFKESHDILRPLPGDLLLIFVRHFELLMSGKPMLYIDVNDERAVHFEWLRTGTEPLVDATQFPAPDVELPSWRGVRTRSCDYVLTGAAKEAFDAAQVQIERELGQSLSRVNVKSMFIHPAWKIGGVPFVIADGDFPMEGTFLCSLISIYPMCEIPLPFVDRPAHYAFEEGWQALEMGTGFVLNIYLGPGGETYCTFQYGD